MPASDLPGEQAWPTQPFPTSRRRSRVSRSEADVTDVSPTRARRLRLFVRCDGRPLHSAEPPGDIVLPGFDGGGEWGGAAVDPERRLYVNASEMPWIAAMREAERAARLTGSPGTSARGILRLSRDQAAVGHTHRDRPEHG